MINEVSGYYPPDTETETVSIEISRRQQRYLLYALDRMQDEMIDQQEDMDPASELALSSEGDIDETNILARLIGRV